MPCVCECPALSLARHVHTFVPDAGFKYYGLEYGQECYGSNDTLATITARGRSYFCDRPCVADGTDGCGGGWSISLYEVSG